MSRILVRTTVDVFADTGEVRHVEYSVETRRDLTREDGVDVAGDPLALRVAVNSTLSRNHAEVLHRLPTTEVEVSPPEKLNWTSVQA